MDDAFKKKGVRTFVAFINWLADKGYIEDDNEVKALFAYRLTGRCRPMGKELPAIEWRGKNNKPLPTTKRCGFSSKVPNG